MAENKNAVATQQPMDMAIDNKFIDGLSRQLTQKEQYGLTFPPNYSVSNALNGAYLMLQEIVDNNKKPVLQSCSKQSIASALMDMTVQGLNPVKKQCYFVAYGGKLTLMRSYQGTMTVAKRVGVKKISSEVIYQGDKFSYHIENGIKIIDEHIQDFKNIDNDKIVGAYAILSLEDGSAYTEIMNINQLEKAWSKGYGYKKGQGVHQDFKDQMAKKTVTNRACKNFINSSDDGYLSETFNNTSENENIDGAQEAFQHDIATEANSEVFDMPEPNQAEVKEEVKEPDQAQAEVIEENPDWMK